MARIRIEDLEPIEELTDEELSSVAGGITLSGFTVMYDAWNPVGIKSTTAYDAWLPSGMNQTTLGYDAWAP